MDVTGLLREDHRAIEHVLCCYENAISPADRRRAAEDLARELTKHKNHSAFVLKVIALEVNSVATASCQTQLQPMDSPPLPLRRAITFIEKSAHAPITLSDIAEAAFATPRSIQYAFRRHLNTTPMQYLRRVRLDHAHLDLLEGDSTSMTVTQVAARWGFSHGGRFAGYYRRRYGQSPQATLRAAPAA